MQRLTLIVAVLALVFGTGLSAQTEPFEIPAETLRGPTAAPPTEESSAAPPAAKTPIALQGGGELIRELTFPIALAPEAEAALEIVPNWLRMDLFDMFGRMSESNQAAYGQLLLSITDPRIIDEVAFTVAHSSEAILAGSDPEVYLKNAELLYQIEPEIPYADIVDYGEAGVDPDYYSTIVYTSIVSGATVQFELPVDIYYWYVVHPKLGDEKPSMSPMLSEQNSTYGYLWREYLFYNPSEEFDYSLNYMVREPNLLTAADLEGWAPAAPGYIDSGGIEGVIVGGPGVEKPVLIEWAWSYGRAIFTTLDVERAAAAGKPEVLENLVMRSAGYRGELLMPVGSGQDQVGIVDDSNDPEILDPITNVLDDNDIAYWVVSMEDMYNRGQWDYFSKVIIPSYQSYDFYASLATVGFMDSCKSWIGDPRIGAKIEFHGACTPENDWSELRPFGKGYVAEPVENVTINPYPVLGDVIKKASHVWDDSYVKAGLSRYRPFEENSMAVDVITNWASRMLSFQARDNRPIQPNQVCYEHDGNCGEIQDLINAAARTCLVPSAGVNNHTWDHVSCEFWDQDWHGYQVGWNVGGASIANQGVLSDKDLGGGKDLSAILQDRGDTYPINATARYSKVCRFHARVEDWQGNPVDCAEVRPYVRYFNQPDGQLVSPLCAFTDSSGEVVMDLGNKRDFWFRIKSKIGDLPTEQILTETVEDEDYYHTWVIEDRSMPQLPPIDEIEFPPVPQPSYRLQLSFNADYETLYSLGGSAFAEKSSESANIDFFITKSGDFHKYTDGEAFAAYEWRRNSAGDDFEVFIPDEEVYYLVFSNDDTVVVKEFVSINVELARNEGGAWIVVEEYMNFVGIPASSSYVIMFNNRLAPSVYVAGFFDAEVDSGEGFQLGIQAFVLDPNGLRDVREVELCYSGIPLGKFLRDDGQGADVAAGDGIFTFVEGYFPGGLPSGVYKLEIATTDMAGNRGFSWPYLNVLSSPLVLQTQPAWSSQASWRQTAATSDDAPVILGGGFFGNDAVRPGDLTRMIVYVDDPDGLSDVERVELYLEGGLATGILLNDDGVGGDDHAGDGIYTFQTNMPGGIPPQSMTLEVVAFDKSGNSSATYPYFTVR